MRTHSRASRRLAGLVTVVALGAGPLAGCAEDPAEPSGSAAYDGSTSGGGGGGGGTTLTVGVFGAFGLKEAGLYDEYMKLNKDITVKQTSIERNENYYPQLLTHLIMAGALLGTLPLLLAFVIFGKHIVGGIMTGAVKG